jgi:hypothetical protein
VAEFALLAGLAAAMPWVPRRLQRQVLLGGSLIAAALLLRGSLIIPVGLAWLSPLVARRAWPNWAKLALLLTVWALVPVYGWLAPRGFTPGFTSLMFYWSTLPAALICLVVERGRGQLEQAEPLDEWLYLLAAPRFFLPFLQPIRAVTFIKSFGRPRFSTAWRGLALGLYGTLGFLIIQYTSYTIKNPGDSFPRLQDALNVGENLLRLYAFNATVIFCAVAQLRLLGYDLGSGYRWPLLSSSVADFYRRWNYYFFEFSSSIYYLPIVSWLRRHVPMAVAHVVGGYLSILLGVWALDNLFSLYTYGAHANMVVQQLKEWHELAAYGLVWSMILLPPALLARFRGLKRSTAWRIAGRVATAIAMVGVYVVFYYYGVALY